MGILKGLPVEYVLDTQEYGKVTINATPNGINVPEAGTGKFDSKTVNDRRPPVQPDEYEMVTLYAVFRANKSHVDVHDTRLLYDLGYNTGGKIVLETPDYEYAAWMWDARHQKELVSYVQDQISDGTIAVANPQEKLDLQHILTYYLKKGEEDPISNLEQYAARARERDEMPYGE